MFELKYALQSISKRKKQNIAIVFAIALGVTIYMSVQVGNYGLVRSYGISQIKQYGQSDIQMTDQGDITGFFQENIKDVIMTPENSWNSDISALSPRLKYLTNLYFEGKYEDNIKIIGIYPDSDLFGEFYSTEGQKLNWQDDILYNTSDSVLISDKLALDLGLSKNSEFSINFALGNGSYTYQSIIVGDIFDSSIGRGEDENIEQQSITDHIIYVNINTMKQFLLPPFQEMINELHFYLSDEIVNHDYTSVDFKTQSFQGLEEIEELIGKIQNIIQDSYPNIKCSSKRVYAAINAKIEMNFTETLDMFNFMLNMTAVLLIINIQIINMNDRKEQTAILRALGADSGKITRTFLIEAFIIGFIGSLIGLITGFFVGSWINSLQDIFTNEILPATINSSIIIGSVLFGVILSVVTAIYPAIKASKKSITEALRGSEETKEKKKSNKKLIFGILLSAGGIYMIIDAGKFWLKSTWAAFSAHGDFLIAFTITMIGIGLILSDLINKKIALNITGIGIFGYALFDMYIATTWIDVGFSSDPGMWGSYLLLSLVLGLTLIVAVNYESILNFFGYLFKNVKSLQGSVQVTIRHMNGKKTRGILQYAILNIILILVVFIIASAETQRTSVVAQHEDLSSEVDIVLNVNIPHPEIQKELEEIAQIEQIFGFRSALCPVYDVSPHANNSEFDINEHLLYRRIVEIPNSIINPTEGVWDSTSLPFSAFTPAEGEDYGHSLGLPFEEQREINIQITKDFLEEKTRTTTIEYKEYDSSNNLVSKSVEEDQIFALGGFIEQFDHLGKSLYLPTNETDYYLPVYIGASVFSMLGDIYLFGGELLVTESVAKQLPIFQDIEFPNIFLIRTSLGFNDETNLAKLSDEIEIKLNDINNPESVSNDSNAIVGASTRVVKTEVYDAYQENAEVWDFLGTFCTIGLVISGAGLILISIRSVSERTREIGMMRAIGFSRRKIILSVIFELMTITVLALFTGILNGILFTDMYCNSFLFVPAAYPISLIGYYIISLMSFSLIAGIFPGSKAAKIAPSQALRYSG